LLYSYQSMNMNLILKIIINLAVKKKVLVSNN